MELEITRPGLVAPVRADPTGRRPPTPGQARGRNWRRTSPGMYVPAAIERGRDQRIVEAAAGLPAGGAVTGWAALAWQGARWFDGLELGKEELPVPVSVGDRRTIDRRRGVVICEDWLFDGDVILVDGLPVTVPARSVSFEARRAWSLERAVQTIDMAAAADLVSIDEMRTYAGRLRGRPGTVQLNDSIGLASENAWSPTEVTMRLEWRRPAGCADAVLLCNPPIFDRDGNHLLTPDLFDPLFAVAGEYNGAVHDGDDPRRRDLDREDLYQRLQIEAVTMMRGDLRDPRRFLRRLDAAYRRASARPRSESWTLEPPPWWVDTSTVDARRALDQETRERWLRRQVA